MWGRRLTVALVAAITTGIASARINLETCWPDTPEQCVKQNSNGTWCYYPSPGLSGERLTSCSASLGHGAVDFKLVMEVHLRSGLSVAHYAGVGNELLGGAGWPVPDPPGIVRLCLSGLGPDGNYRTTCTNVEADNRLPVTTWCSVNFGQTNLQDGCYPPPSDPLALSPYSSSPSADRSSDGTLESTINRSGTRGRHSNTGLQYILLLSFVAIYRLWIG